MELAVSHWTRVEFSSLIAREVSMRGLDVHRAAAIYSLGQTLLKAGKILDLPVRMGIRAGGASRDRR